METHKFQEKDKLNLKYVVQRPLFSISWKTLLLLVSFLCSVILIVWLGYPKSEEILITHQITAGDTLPNLAKRYYGSQSGWKKIFLANRSKLMKNKHGLIKGDKLQIPLSPVQFNKWKQTKQFNSQQPH